MHSVSPKQTIGDTAQLEPSAGDSRVRHRILFALTTLDVEKFFPQGINVEGLQADIHYASDNELSGDNWSKLIRHFEPSIIVTGWATPRLSNDIIENSWFKAEYICHLSGSVRSFLPVELIDRGVLVTNWGTLAAVSVAEHAVMLVLACARNLTKWHPPAESYIGGYSNRHTTIRTRTLREKRVGIHGFGNIAKQIVHLLRPFGVKMSAYSHAVPSEEIEKNGLDSASDLKSLFADNDILIECEALTEKTRGSVTEELLSSLPEDAIFVNVGRGALVDESALIRLAAENRLRVATDVTTREPLSPDDPLWNAPTILRSPHIGGPTSDLYEHCGQFALANIRRFLNNERVRAIINREIYARST
ncbi:hydroxyacid dehydrogenase [Cerasicoccus arenae]|uniref:D-isomer specific 2-hydroxyacid dehydrogenase NAD-binding domain-containing protein n=1 Tax=Cerasicoccus arenae TaxID=424488 RepID=A0A8J3GC91_9BACT|nr:hydroxyacid dehydrogenase [Cerasicoccus arenae]MBK1858121.1 hydroxyacid dehydrogenase [Cerasicoccus arenae]GHB96612.1 hypothetical protein GCM10007047_10640 [Cerasicoccus arenae]